MSSGWLDTLWFWADITDMFRKVLAISIFLVWFAVFSVEIFDAFAGGGSMIYGSRPLKASLVSLGQGTHQGDEDHMTAPHKLSSQANCFNVLTIKNVLSCRAKVEVKIHKEDFKLYKLHSVFLV